MVDRSPRSSKYQYLILETAFAHDMLESFSTDDSISARLNPFEYNEEILELEDQLKEQFWKIVDTLLTDKQKEVLHLLSDGYTQTEIAKKLNINQSSVAKNISGSRLHIDAFGELEYGSSPNGKQITYGGSKKKLQQLVESDPKINEILARINEIRSNKW